MSEEEQAQELYKILKVERRVNAALKETLIELMKRKYESKDNRR